MSPQKTKKISRKSRPTGSKMKFLVTLKVKNGPFATKDIAEKSRAILQNKGISTTDSAKTAKGYIFTSKLGYSVPNAGLKQKIIAKLSAQAKSSGLPKTSYSITARKLGSSTHKSSY